MINLKLIQGWQRAWRLTSVQAAALLTVISTLMILRNELLPMFAFAIPAKYYPWITGIWGAIIIVLRIIAQPGVLGAVPEQTQPKNKQRGFVIQHILLVLAGVLLAFLVGLFEGNRRAKARCAKAQTAAVSKAAKTDAAVTTATQAVADKEVITQTQIKTVFKDRIIKQYIEVPRYVIKKEDANCVVPERFVGLWNSANRAELHTFTGQLDAAASGVKLSDISAQKEREAELCHRNTEQLKALQAAERTRQKAVEESAQ